MTTAEHAATLDRPSDDRITEVVALAQRAPSVHNTQPWRWKFDGLRLSLMADADRILPAADPFGREQVISCGAVLHHARTAFAAQGWHTDIVRMPDPAHPDQLAVIDFRPWPQPPAGIAARASAIEHRYTDRLPMDEPREWDKLVARLQQLVSPRGLRCEALARDIQARVAALSGSAQAARSDDRMYQDELHWWAGHPDSTSGVPPSGLISDAEFARVGVARHFPSAPHSDRRSGRIDRARIIVLSSPGESPAQWLHSGEALSAVLLECTVAGAATCPVTHLTEMPAARRVLAALIDDHGCPQVLVRVGAAPGAEPRPRATPRRSVDEVLEFTHR